ncbi:MAG: hypothetical protein OZ923_04955 [Comamonadaceae bacterium]|nr:hypothetical protein [Burkholderiales bacterium]MEB2347941.1 hypothetical protein [Comamonadaceae bacterium]
MFADVLLSGVFALTLGAIAQSHGRRMPWLGMALQLALPPLAPWCSRPPAQRRGASGRGRIRAGAVR